MNQYKFLSIDFDFFFKTNDEIRDIFPNEEYVGDNRYKNDLASWIVSYNECDEINKIKPSLRDFNIITKLINNQKQSKIYISSTHEDAYRVITKEFPIKSNLEVMNIDYHHDMYDARDLADPLNCGNWLRQLYKLYNVKSTWFAQEESYEAYEKELEGGIYFDINKIKDTDFNAIFLCKSEPFTPPHLDKDFLKLVDNIQKEKVLLSKTVMINRIVDYNKMKKLIA